MKRILLSLMALAAITSVAQRNSQEDVQSGTPALMEVKGRKLKVFLQRMEDGKLTFQMLKKPSDMTVPADKISSIQFVSKYDEAGLNSAYGAADYDAVLSILEPIMADIGQYMPISNNMREPFVMMFEAYRGKKDFANVKKHADLMIATGDEKLIDQTKVALALAAIDREDFAEAEKLGGELENEAAKLYVRAEVERAQGKPKEAIQTVNAIIFDHGNDLEWLPRGELLNAYLYLDMTSTNSTITTNSAMLTARQVKNIYAGGNIAGEARIFWESLGGAPIEAEEIARRAELRAKAKELKDKRAAEDQANREKRAAERRAQAVAKREAEAKAAESDAAE